jgi:hypothetical protein
LEIERKKWWGGAPLVRAPESPGIRKREVGLTNTALTEEVIAIFVPEYCSLYWPGLAKIYSFSATSYKPNHGTNPNWKKGLCSASI